MKLTTRLTAAALVAFLTLGGAAQPAEALAAVKGQTSKKKTPKKKPKAPTVKAVNNANCPIMNAAIGSMGPGTSVTHKGHKVSVCCAGCAGKFQEAPDAYLQAALAGPKKQ